MSKNNILIVDLNNEAPFPTLAVGYLITPLKQCGYNVNVYSPLAYGIKPLERDVEESVKNYIASRVRFATHPFIEWANEAVYKVYQRIRFRPTKKFKEQTRKVIRNGKIDLILVSSYLQYDRLLEYIAKLADKEGIKLLLGGPFFNMPKVVEKWINIKGVTAVFGGEPELMLQNIVDDMLQDRDISLHQGVFQKNGTRVAGHQAAPLKNLNLLPVPDFEYYNWATDDRRVIPVMATRGCGWGKCLFCSDIITSSTRTFRSRSKESVFNEIRLQSERYKSKSFIFFDSKLNSDLSLWSDIIDDFQSVVPGATWVATVHVDGKGDNGLDLEMLSKAYDAGLRRVSFGLETGSQSLNNKMLKGTKIERMSDFVKDARKVGISVRTTVMLGYPGESAEDIEATIKFLLDHYDDIDRVHLSRFKAIPGTGFENRLGRKPTRYEGIKSLKWDYKFGRAEYRYVPDNKAMYRYQKAGLIKLVHRMNKRPLMDSAQQFNGMM